VSQGQPIAPIPETPDQVLDRALADVRLAAVLARANQPLDDEQRAALRRICERHIDLARKLRAVPLGNADEPEIVFLPFRAGDAP
jgi:hypothetical protein